MILLLCGYQTSGKDTVYNDICNGTFDKRWKCNDHTKNIFLTHYRRIGIADELKNHTIHKYNLDPDVKKTDVINRMNMMMSYRELLVYEAMITKQQCDDVDVWMRKAMATFIDGENVCITDWRFPHELAYIKTHFPNETIITARVKRANVPIPLHIAEHQLDDYKTDLLIVGK